MNIFYLTILVLGTYAPWMLVGSIASYYGQSGSSKLALLGVGGALGLLGTSLIPFLINEFALPVGSETIRIIFSVLLFTLLVVKARRNSSPACIFTVLQFVRRQSGFSKLLLTVVIMNLAITFMLSVFSPVFGWDVLNFWAEETRGLIRHIRLYLGQDFGFEHRHPITVPLMQVWLLGLPAEKISSVGINMLGTAWVLFFVSYIFVVTGVCAGVSNKWLLPILLASSVPLVENHLAVSGYVELLVGVCFVSLVCLITMMLKGGFFSSNLPPLFLCFLLITSLVLLKNTGLIYVVAVTGALALVLLLRCIYSYRLSVGRVATWLVFFGAPMLFLAGYLLAICNLLPYDQFMSVVLRFGGYSEPLRLDYFLRIPENLLFSKVLNQTYSVCFVLAGLCSVPFLSRAGICDWRLLPILAFVFCTTLFVLTQLTTHGFKFAVPAADTGHSRFILPALMLVPLLFCILESSLNLVRVNAPEKATA